ncbi:MAG: hypothetical protein LBU29_00040 [Endomicrobium sp.]|nr:hypothetical protein [Endomicrobium sp.]
MLATTLGFDNGLGDESFKKGSTRGEWGIFDEYLFDSIFEILSKDDKSKFIFAMTTTNHPLIILHIPCQTVIKNCLLKFQPL